MPDSADGVSSFVTRRECILNHNHLGEQIMENKTSIEKHQIALYGNGRDGIVMQLNRVMWRSQFIDKGVSVVIALLTSLLTYFLMKRFG